MTPPEQHSRVPSQDSCPASTGVTLIIPSLGAPSLPDCLLAVYKLDPPPDRVILVLSGAAGTPPDIGNFDLLRVDRRCGFSRAFNAAFNEVHPATEFVAVLNDDAFPQPNWLGKLVRGLDGDHRVASVQGTVTDGSGAAVDGRGIAFDPYGVPVQMDHGQDFESESNGSRNLVAVSGTAAVYRTSALHQARLRSGAIFDPSFGNYHEDLDLGLRLGRLGWKSAWTGNAVTRHLGSVTGRRMRWGHPWWLLANRWRALAGNLHPTTLCVAFPRLLRGEVRAVRTLLRDSPRAVLLSLAVIAALPILIGAGWRRHTPGARLSYLPGEP